MTRNFESVRGRIMRCVKTPTPTNGYFKVTFGDSKIPVKDIIKCLSKNRPPEAAWYG